MRILLKLTLDCDLDAAWRAMHSPRAVADLYGPFVELTPMSAEGMPTTLEPGTDVPVRMTIGGPATATTTPAVSIALGAQLIHVTDRYLDDSHGEVRILRDSGIPLTGPLAALDIWDHQMAVSTDPADPGKTLWRERLVIGGPAALALWPVLWGVWQWRAVRLRHLARSWAHDPEAEPQAPTSTAAE